MRQILIIVGVLAAAGCSGASSETFEPGDSNDAVVRMAQSALSNGLSTVQVTITNPSTYALGEGLVALTPIAQINTTTTAAMLAYLRGPGTALGNARQLATSAGLTVNVSAFLVPAIPAGGTATIIINAAPGAQLYYVARETLTTPDFVGSYSAMSWPNGTSGTFQTGFTLDTAGNIVRGNTSVGATPNIAVIAFDVLAGCNSNSSGSMTRPGTLFSDTFAGGPNDSRWPMNAGYDADFNGDWTTDGVTARVWNPPGGNPQAPRPVTTGFVKFIDVCPTDGATISIGANIDAAFTSLSSSATLVLYYFDAANALIRVDANHKIGKGNVRRTTLVDSAVPRNARRIAVVPMAYLAPDETSTLFFSKLNVTYAPKNTYQVTTIANESLSSGS
ncbi:MAG: hypothetical protein JNG84_06220, partial [Archangium sp.]|nr:hypothetical protein [Archangium sp.]